LGLELKNLTKHFGKVSAVRDLSMVSGEHEFISLVGPSGCGKTTLLRIIAGLESADGGSVIVDERIVSELPPKDRDVAMVFQGESLYPHLTVYENLAFPLKMRNRPADEIKSLVKSTASQLDVGDLLERMPNTLSGGQRQRVAIGRALVRKPKVFLLDEPFSHLDAHLRRQLREELKRLRTDWTATTLFVTHDQREAMMLGDRVAVMNDGEILQFDVPQEIRDSPATDFVASFVTDEY
jgi:multiple sugar transport system ATP-binding protein